MGKVKEMSSYESDFDWDVNAWSVIRWAVKYNHFQVLKELLKIKPSDVSLEDVAVMCAEFDRLDVLQYILRDRKTKPTAKMLSAACRSNAQHTWPYLYDVCRHFLSRQEIQKVIYDVALAGYVHIIRQFMKDYPDILKKGFWKLTHICSRGHLDVVKLLVEEGNADIHQDKNYSVLCALINDHLELAKYLVSKGAKVFDQGDYAIKNVKVVRIVDFLVEQGLDQAKIPKWYYEKKEWESKQKQP